VKRTLKASLRHARRIVITVVGATVVAIGVAMIVLPGPAFIVIPAGLAILGLEFAWARRWLAVVRQHTESAIGRARGSGSGDSAARLRDGDDDVRPPL
jgi:tellurite resistance protein TerC